ncbi:MAG: 2,5-diamino-6-(ribosylamino)-4(3H)-pyrimidinone 5'-phosphate reductase [Candidatus Lokiarchaeota archaeon]|nr:2,5-diamino-6-(ribosylamino)-4(3H)-pyrimidinone 5'-phosphate reductase [Candidatus Lokiarchaeota archaeon]
MKFEKPYIILSAAMTIDGKIASKKGDPELSDLIDWKHVHKLRTDVDAIMVGKGTIIQDDPKLHIKYYNHNGYTRIILDSNLSIPIDSQVINYKPEIYPTIICTTENATEVRIKEFKKRNISIIKSGHDKQVDLLKLMPILKKKGINSIILEGGGTLNWSFIKNDLIDEIRLTIAPWIIGGKDATSLVEGKGFDKMIEGKRFNLINVNNRDNYVVLNYKRKRE